ncbi:MAG TPA: electron transfer flavoprotein subunit alpha/FixB family protein [Chloroflexota bacterium]|jgi:electron transfer flavoprotein alpha subunit
MTLVVAETAEGALAPITAELIGAAARLGGPVSVLLAGDGVRVLADEVGRLGAARVLVADDPRLSPFLAEAWLPLVLEAVGRVEPDAVLLGHTLTGRELGPLAAFRLGVGMVTDCVALEREGEALVLSKPVYGGNALAEYVIEAGPPFATLRPRSFAPHPEEEAEGSVDVVELAVAEPPGRARVVETVRREVSGPVLEKASVVVSGGRGLGGPENWHYVEELASALGAAVGASRAVTDAGWVPPTLQVGLTGTTVNPDLYVAVGISGAVQHMAGCGGARNIVAINRDPTANVFRHARFGIVGDFREILPALTERIRELRA